MKIHESTSSGTCGVCEKDVKLKKNGELRAHNISPGHKCPGSGGDPTPTFVIASADEDEA